MQHNHKYGQDLRATYCWEVPSGWGHVCRGPLRTLHAVSLRMKSDCQKEVFPETATKAKTWRVYLEAGHDIGVTTWLCGRPLGNAGGPILNHFH